MHFGTFTSVGVPLMFIGFALYSTSAVAFLLEGKGTPAIWFTRRLKSLIGEEPETLVRSTLYKFTRNPMYLGVVTFVLGEAVWFDTSVLIIYAVFVWFCFHLIVVFIEEPHLRRKNRILYDEYCRTVPRWIGFRVLK